MARYGLGAATEMRQTEMRWRSFGAAKAKPKSRQNFFGGGVAYRTPLHVRPHHPTLLPFTSAQLPRIACHVTACPTHRGAYHLRVAVVVETGHHKSGAAVFHGVANGGLNLLALGDFILRLLSDVMCSTLEGLRSGRDGADGWSG